MSALANSTSTNGPVGTVLGDGSTGLRMTTQERQVAELVSTGCSYKRIGSELELDRLRVGRIVSAIATRIPGQGNPRQQVSAWMWVYGGGNDT